MFYKQYTKALFHSQLKKNECRELSRNKFGLMSRDSRSYFNFAKTARCFFIYYSKTEILYKNGTWVSATSIFIAL